MADEGPTTAGSIQGKLDILIDKWLAHIEQAKAAKQELMTGDNDVKIDANVAEALAKMESVQAAERELGVGTVRNINLGANTGDATAKLTAVQLAEQKLAIVSDSLRLAYQRLDEVQESGTARQSTLMAAELAATKAEQAHASAVRELSEAQIAAAASTDRLSTADDELFVSQTRANKAAGDGLQRWQVIAIAVAALIPLLGPLVGYASAVAGGLTLMGLAGVAAVVGIKNEMEQGTREGEIYSQGIRTLKNDLNGLTATAALAMLASYDQAIQRIHADMPELNDQTRIFTVLLGQTGNFLLQGVINALNVLEPLLITGAVYVEQLGAGFLSWTQNGGLEKFGTYALNVLPQVASTLGQLVKLALDVVEAAAPWGTVMLGAISAAARVLDTFPLPVLGAIAAGAAGGYAAFKLWTGANAGITAVKDALGLVRAAIAAHLPLQASEIELSGLYTAALTTEAGVLEAVAIGEDAAAKGAVAMDAAMDANPVGVLFAALGALAAIISVVVGSTNSATDATSDYTAAVQQDSGAIGENVRAQAASNLQKDGALKAAKSLGIATKAVTDATLGSTSAYDKVTAKVKAAQAAYGIAATTARETTGADYAAAFAAQKAAKERLLAAQSLLSSVNSEKSSIKDQIKSYNDLQEALGGTTIKTQAQFDAQVALAGQYGASLPNYLSAVDANKKTKDQADATTLSLRLENDASTLLSNALTILNGGSLDVAQAQTGLAAANNSLTDSFHQNGIVVNGNSKAAVANQQAIQEGVQAAQQYAEAVGKQTGSSEAAVQALADSKKSMEDNLRSQGLLTDGVQAYIDKIFQIPASIPPTKIDADTTAATKKLQELQAFIQSFNTATQMRIDMGITSGPNMEERRAGGGTIRGFADGGSPSGTVFGPGTSTSDSVLTRLSVGEEVIRASSAAPVRPLLKAINKNPQQAVAQVMAAGAAQSGKTEIHHHWQVITQADPTAAIKDGIRQLAARTA